MPPSHLEQLRLACQAPPTPSADWLHSAGHAVMNAMLADHLHHGEARIGETGTRDELEALLREPPPEAGMDLEQVLAVVKDKIIGRAFRTSHPRFLAFVPGAPTFVAVLGDALAANANLFAGVWKEAA